MEPQPQPIDVLDRLRPHHYEQINALTAWPGQLQDAKCAIRFLRAEGERLHVDSSRIVVVGSSAGGHLAALIGVTNQVAELEGLLGHLKYSSSVQGIISLYGASNLQTILSQSTPKGLAMRAR